MLCFSSILTLLPTSLLTSDMWGFHTSSSSPTPGGCPIIQFSSDTICLDISIASYLTSKGLWSHKTSPTSDVNHKFRLSLYFCRAVYTNIPIIPSLSFIICYNGSQNSRKLTYVNWFIIKDN